MTIATNEKAKWERDIARSHQEQTKSVQAQSDASQFLFRGMSAAAEYTRERATNEAAIVRAMREGNTELAQQLQKMGNISAKEQLRSRFVTASGRVKSDHEVKAEMRKERQKAERINRRMSHLENDNNFISDAHRDTAGRIIGGTNMLTGLPAQTEMQYRESQKAEESEQKKREGEISKKVMAGTATPDQAMTRIAQLMESWNN